MVVQQPTIYVVKMFFMFYNEKKHTKVNTTVESTNVPNVTLSDCSTNPSMNDTPYDVAIQRLYFEFF
jgi:hypothetical protein